MKVGADDYLITRGPEVFRELLDTAWAFNPDWSDPEAEVWWQVRELHLFPKFKVLHCLASLESYFAKMREGMAAALLEELRERLKLKKADLAPLFRSIQAIRKARGKDKSN